MRTVSLAVLLLAVAVPAAGAQKMFEGQVDMRMSDNGKDAQPMQIWMKAGKSRMEMQAGPMQMAMIMDFAASKMTMMMPSQSMYMEMPLNLQPDAAEMPDVTVTRTGKKDTVAGHTCEIVTIVDSKGNSTDVCGATDMGSFVMGQGPMQRGKAPAWARGMESFFPLRVTDNKKKRVVLEVTKIAPGPVPDSKFTVPEGYTVMSMPGM